MTKTEMESLSSGEERGKDDETLTHVGLTDIKSRGCN
jgi:hypothetical protein